MSVIKYHAFIYFMRPPPWYGTVVKADWNYFFPRIFTAYLSKLLKEIPQNSYFVLFSELFHVILRKSLQPNIPRYMANFFLRMFLLLEQFRALSRNLDLLPHCPWASQFLPFCLTDLLLTASLPFLLYWGLHHCPHYLLNWLFVPLPRTYTFAQLYIITIAHIIKFLVVSFWTKDFL